MPDCVEGGADYGGPLYGGEGFIGGVGVVVFFVCESARETGREARELVGRALLGDLSGDLFLGLRQFGDGGGGFDSFRGGAGNDGGVGTGEGGAVEVEPESGAAFGFRWVDLVAAGAGDAGAFVGCGRVDGSFGSGMGRVYSAGEGV